MKRFVKLSLEITRAVLTFEILGQNNNQRCELKFVGERNHLEPIVIGLASDEQVRSESASCDIISSCFNTNKAHDRSGMVTRTTFKTRLDNKLQNS